MVQYNHVQIWTGPAADMINNYNYIIVEIFIGSGRAPPADGLRLDENNVV